ncbi:hypothetical protein FF38_11341 [Lucilia cuprina]|uniref:Uncharacterized protein n=1 Tax=Lucilia cuprina TaxID=7375 RepID=A0A0L0C636_LUCCU|nr:hypothetical protein FF38_11341 [Lucilia cuprina]
MHYRKYCKTKLQSYQPAGIDNWISAPERSDYQSANDCQISNSCINRKFLADPQLWDQGLLKYEVGLPHFDKANSPGLGKRKNVGGDCGELELSNLVVRSALRAFVRLAIADAGIGAKLPHAERLRLGRLARAELNGPGVRKRADCCCIRGCVSIFEVLKNAGFAMADPMLPPVELSSMQLENG